MAKRQTNRLSARAVATLKPDPSDRYARRYADGGNLYLIVDKSGAKRWALLYRDRRDGGRFREMGLGSLSAVSLAEARQKAADARKLIDAGQDPISHRRASRAAGIGAAITFGEYADRYINETVAPRVRNEKHLAQWRSTLSNDAAALHGVSLAGIGNEDVLAVLKPIWQAKPETASRLRGRIERVLDAAIAQGLRSGANPARWHGHLKAILPAPTEIKERGHHTAMPYANVPAFMAALRERPAIAARALEFAILTAARTGEVLGVNWAELDLDAGEWTVPASRMKAKKEHRVPLSGRALEILRELKGDREQPAGFVFPGERRDQPLSSMALLMLLRRMEVTATAHGFRSSFRDWVGDKTSFPREVAEAALAHGIGDKAEAAYRRGTALEKRRELMESWASYCATPRDRENVVPLFG